MDYLPLFVELKQRPVLLVGGGHVAARKAVLLLKRALGYVLSRHSYVMNASCLSKNQIEWIAGQYQSEYLLA